MSLLLDFPEFVQFIVACYFHISDQDFLQVDQSAKIFLMRLCDGIKEVLSNFDQK